MKERRPCAERSDAPRRRAAAIAVALVAVLSRATARADELTSEPCAPSVVVDGHSGQVMCPPADDRRVPAAVPEPPREARRAVVDVDPPKFQYGEIAGAPASIERMRRDVERCVNVAPRERSLAEATQPLPPPAAPATLAMTGDPATLSTPLRSRTPLRAGAPSRSGANTAREASVPSLQRPSAMQLTFLVRAPGRAEGVAITPTGAASRELLQCVSSVLSGRLVGTPSSDAVGVAVTFRVRELKKH